MISLPRRSSSLSILTVIIGILVIGGIIGLVYLLGTQARQRLLQNQAQQFQAPTTAVKQQVKKITLKKTTPLGEEIIEITNDGKIVRYDKNGRILQSGNQGFGTMRGLFEIVEKYLENGQGVNIPGGYQLIVETNKGTIILDETTNPPGSSDDDGNIIDDIIDIIDPVLNPTPRPSASPYQAPTPTPFPSPHPSSTPSASPGLPPDYTQVPPFDCADYYESGKRLKISNVYCGLDEVNSGE